VAFVAREEGEPEVYTMPAEGGPSRRLTFLGAWSCLLTGWSSDGLRIAFASSAKSAHGHETELFEVDASGGMPRALNMGHAVAMATQKSGATVIARNHNDPARWKRYRGGMAGERLLS
jgi:tricorn protease